MTITNTESGTNVHEIAAGIFRISTPIPPSAMPGGFTFNQILLVDENPLLFHTGPRRMFPLVREAVAHVLGDAAKLYANGTDLKDPQLSPIYGDFTGFPPAILTSGTRDLFLSLTVLTHRKLRRAGVEADLQVFEGMSHAQYNFDSYAPETKETFTEIARFFDKHLGK